jgi:hypothetical protein
MALTRVTTEVFFTAPGATRTSLLVTTLTRDSETIRREAMHKAKVCYGLDIHDLRLGSQSIS